MLILLSMAVYSLYNAIITPILRRLFPPPKIPLQDALISYFNTLDPGPCADLLTLIAYKNDTLNPEEAEELLDHLALCHRCTHRYLELIEK